MRGIDSLGGYLMELNGANPKQKCCCFGVQRKAFRIWILAHAHFAHTITNQSETYWMHCKFTITICNRAHRVKSHACHLVDCCCTRWASASMLSLFRTFILFLYFFRIYNAIVHNSLVSEYSDCCCICNNEEKKQQRRASCKTRAKERQKERGTENEW